MRIDRALAAPVLIATLMASACGPSGPLNGFEVPTNVTTDDPTSLPIGKVFIDLNNASAAFLILARVEGGVVGEPFQGFSVPMGRQDPLTVNLEEEHKLEAGLQQIQVTVYLDNPESPNGMFDASDPIAKAGDTSMQKTITVEYTPQLSSYVEFETDVETDDPREFDLGMISIREEDTGAKNVLLTAYRDEGGERGELLMVRDLGIDFRQAVSVKLEPPARLVGGEQTIHVVVWFEDDEGGELDDGDTIGELDGEELEYEITVTNTNASRDPILELEDAITVTTPFEFEVGTYTVPTDLGSRYWVVTRLVEGGEPGKVLGVNEPILSFDERTLKVTLEHQVELLDQQIHVAFFRSALGEAWTVENFDPASQVLTNDAGEALEGVIDVEFISTVSDPDSEYYKHTCGDDDNAARHLMYKTDLPIDCRCAINRVTEPTFELCNGRAVDENGYTLGDGPRFAALGGHMTSGDVFPERDEIIFGIDRGGSGDPRRKKFTIVALNYETNTRRMVSGEVADPFQGEYVLGQGPLSGEAGYMRRGPNGELFVFGSFDGGEILRVDPDTGDRELLWKHDDERFGQCPNGVPVEGDADWRLGDSQPANYQLNFQGRGFTVDPRDGSFYVPTRNNGVPNPGYGVVKISGDGSTCAVLTTSGAEERNDYFGGVGAGYELDIDVGSMMWHEGKLLGIAGSDLIEIDPDTGDRTRIAGSAITGSSGVPNSYRMSWDPDLEMIVLSGILPPNGPNLVGVDLESRQAWAFKCEFTDEDSPVTACLRGPQSTLNIAYWPAYRLPDGDYLGGIFMYGFTTFEILTGNSYMYNY